MLEGNYGKGEGGRRRSIPQQSFAGAAAYSAENNTVLQVVVHCQ